MRSKILKLNQVTVEVFVYNTKKKAEETVTATYYPAVDEAPKLPKDCVEISKMVTDEKEVKLKMTAQDFVKHATLVEE